MAKKSILEEAIKDANILKQTALVNARNVLVEAISPKIKEFVESQLGEMTDEDECEDEDKEGEKEVDEASMSLDGSAGLEAAMYEKNDDDAAEADDVELLKQLGVLDVMPASTELNKDKKEKEDKEELEEMNFSDVNEEKDAEKEKEEESEEEKVDEVVNITNEDLKAALSEVFASLKTEATVTSGFADVQTPDEAGLADKANGEKHWKDVDPPASKDMTVKEAKTKIAALQKENAEYKKAYNLLRGKLQEVNLFNSKLMYTHKLLNLSELNNKQRLAVVEAFDRATNTHEVELVYRSLSESFKIAGVLSEGKQAAFKASKAKASRLSGPSSTVLKEAMIKEEQTQASEDNSFADRMKELAGLVG